MAMRQQLMVQLRDCRCREQLLATLGMAAQISVGQRATIRPVLRLAAPAVVTAATAGTSAGKQLLLQLFREIQQAPWVRSCRKQLTR
jgi:hypothetical protein